MQYENYRQYMQRLADLRYAQAVLQWDQEVYLPKKGAGLRARQMATLSEEIHRLSSAEELGTMLKELLEQPNLSGPERRNIELSWDDFSRQKKYTADFVRRMSETVSRSFHSWIEARQQNRFAHFAPDLLALVELKKQEADLLGFEGHPYNALLDEYEKGATVNMLDKVFDGLVGPLKGLLGRIREKEQAGDAFLHQFYPRQAQWDFGLGLIRDLGFDFDAGRQDLSEHPFTTSFGRDDVRITTRIDEQNLGNMTWSCIHELGHALYEQGLPASEYGLPSGEFASLAIHESQSRLWENQVGRSRSFWAAHYGQLQKYFPEQLNNISLDSFYRGINKVYPSLIRTEADELTYHFHVIIRYELEKALIGGGLNVSDIPGFWNAHYASWLGVTVPDDRNGCLQDVHWSHGSFGYFPTYSLGSLYAAQFYRKAAEEIGDLEMQVEKGNTRELLEWLRVHIHAKGRLLTSEDLCREVTGEPLNAGYFLGYLLDKYTKIYDL